MARAAGLPIRGLHVLDAAVDAPLAWAAWGIRTSDNDQHVTLALVSRDPGRAAVRWSVRRDDGYDPTIRTVYGWRYGEGSVLALQYQFGAAYARIEFYGMDRGGTPRLLDAREGALISLNAVKGGAPLLVLYDPKPVALAAHCATWDGSAHKLRPHRCGF